MKKKKKCLYFRKEHMCHMAALVQPTASFRILPCFFHSCQPTRKKARVMDKIRGRNKAITMHSTPVHRGQGHVYTPIKGSSPSSIREISLYFGISDARSAEQGGGADFGRRCRASFRSRDFPSISGDPTAFCRFQRLVSGVVF